MDRYKNRAHLIGSLSAIACEILFGLSYVFTKRAIGHASALSLLGWRFLVGFLAMAVLNRQPGSGSVSRAKISGR